MYQTHTLIFYYPLTPKQYLDTVLSTYPFDIDPSLVYTLLTKTPYPHPALLTFIDYIRSCEKYLICEDSKEPKLNQLFVTMCKLSQRNEAVLHTHQFHFDCLLHTTPCPLAHPYTYLPYDKIAMIDQILINHRTQITLPKQHTSFIHYDDSFPFHDLSIDPKHYFALSVQAAQVQGLILIPKALAAYATALSSLYSLNVNPTHHNFLLLYGIQMPYTQNIITYDRNYKQYIGCSIKQQESDYSLNECLHMIQSLISLIKVQQQDYVLSATMLEITVSRKTYGTLIYAPSNHTQSIFSDLLLNYLQSQEYPCQAVFENYGILHLLDDAVSATGAQIGSYIQTASLSKESILEKLTAAVLINEQEKNTHMILPLTTYEKSCRFHKVHVLCILVNTAQQTITRIESLDELEQYKPHHYLLTDHEMNKQFDILWNNLCKAFVLNSVLILKIPFSDKKTIHSSKLKKQIEQIIAMISDQY